MLYCGKIEAYFHLERQGEKKYMTNICIIATIIIYLVAMLLVGFAYSKSNNDSTDFYLGGRKMGPLVTAMSAEASDMSSWLRRSWP